MATPAVGPTSTELQPIEITALPCGTAVAPSAPMEKSTVLFAISLFAAPSSWAWGPFGRTQAPARRPASVEINTHGLGEKEVSKLVRAVNAQRVQGVRGRARFFSKITAGDHSGERVVYQDKNVTAFLDMTDPKHPRFNPEMEDEGDLSAVPPARRAHILVVPNTPREHIGQTLGGSITSADLEATLQVVKAGEALAKTMGLKNPRVFINPQDKLSVGYLHVHVVGERDPSVPYPTVP